MWAITFDSIKEKKFGLLLIKLFQRLSLFVTCGQYKYLCVFVHVEKETVTWCGLIDGGPTLPIIRAHKRMLLCSASSSRPQPEVSA